MQPWFKFKKLAIFVWCLWIAPIALAQNEAITNVETLVLVPRPLQVQSTYVGHLEPSERVVIRAEAEGTVEKIFRQEGQRVKKGGNLVNISTERLSLKLRLAQANYELAKSEYNTEKLLFDREVSTASKLDSVRTNRDVKSINLELATLDFEKSKVRSPIAGVVKSRNVEVGSFVNRGQNLFEIMDISQVLVSINIPEREMRFMSVGKPVSVRIDAVPGDIFKGKIKTLGLEADLKNRSFPAEIVLSNKKSRLLPGMMARVEMVTIAVPSEIIVPRDAVLERESGKVVFIEKDGKALERPVLLGTTIKDEVQVLSGLQKGERLIVTGQHFLTDKESVKVIKSNKQQAGSS